jgi:hypothetical protein
MRLGFIAAAPLVILPVSLNAARSIRGLPEGSPAATIDLMTEAGLLQVQGQWRSSEWAYFRSLRRISSLPRRVNTA